MMEKRYEILMYKFHHFDKRMEMALFLFSVTSFFVPMAALCSAKSLFSLKIKCLIPLYGTVKGHWERLTLPDTLHQV